MSELIKLFRELPPPLNNTEFSAVPVHINSLHKIGRDVDGHPVLLVAIKETRSKTLLPNVNLKNIKVLYDRTCKVSRGAMIEEGKFTIVIFTGSDVNLYDSFLRFCEVLLDSLKGNLGRDAVAKILDRCVKLFKDISKAPTKTVHGLWAELFFIYSGKNKIKLIETWHINPEDTWDFNLGKTRYEIKSSSNRKRQHFFSHEQLRLVGDSEIIIISLFAEEAGVGKSIEDLISELTQFLTRARRADLIEKLYFICYSTLGNSLDDSFKVKFDSRLAKSSITAYSLSMIPKIVDETIPPQITELKYKVDLAGVKPNLGAIRSVLC